MKKVIKRVSAAVVALAVMLTAVLLDVPEKVTAAEIVQSGTCGDNITWTFDADGVLTISGTGAMPNYGSVSTPPWKDLKDQIKSVVIENGVTSIGSYAFYQCASLTNADLPDSVKVLGNKAFYECSNLIKIIIPDSVTSITGTYTFYGCAQLAEVTLSNNLTTLPESMFNRCSALKSITIPDSVTEIGQDVFLRCTSLTSLTIPSSVQTIGEEVVGWCSELKTVVIENGLTSLSLKAFFECSGLTSVTLPESLTKIDGGAFNRCKSLESITIPENVTSIGNNAFTNCTSLENITIPDSVTSIGLQAFSDCKTLKNITIPKSVTSIGKEVFKGCTLNEVRFGGKTPPTLPANSDLCTATSTEKITVPCTAVDQYKTADGFSNLADKISGKHTLTKTEAKSPTCTEDGNKEYWHCSECGKYFSDSACTNVITDTVIAQTGHYYNATWSSDDTNHWHECSRCDGKIDIANHTFVQKSDGTNHWEECSDCKYKNGEAAHSWGDWTLTTEPTLNTTGTAERTCSCGEKQTKTDVPKLTDPIWAKGNRTDPTLNSTGSEKYTSEYGEVTVTIPKLTDTTVWTKDERTDSTLNNTGSEKYTSEYGEVTVTIPKLTDTTVWTKDERTDPTLNDTGSEKYTSEYGEVTVTIPKLTDTTVWTKDGRTEPTLNDTGSEKYTGEYGEVTVTIPALTDTTVWTKNDNKHIDPTEDSDGEDVYTSEYGEITVTIPKLEHTHVWQDWEITKTSTLKTTGKAERVCTKDSSHKETKVLPALSDSTVWTKDDNRHIDPTEDNDGEDVYTSEYGEITVVLPSLEHTHTWGGWTIATEPTLTATGTAKRVCTKNGAHIDTKTIPALSDTTVWTKDDNKHIDPTEDNDGEDVYTSEYGEVTVTIPQLGHTHTWSGWTIATEPTLTATGTANRVCTKNGAHIDTKTLPALSDTTVWTKDDNRHIDPTEDNDGEDVYTSEYGEVTVTIPQLGHTHTWGGWTIATEPTLTATGTANRVCTKNGAHIDTKTLPALSDSTVWTKDDNRHIDPTEDNDGEDVYTSEYGEITVTIPQLGHTHTWGGWTIATEPTLTATGTAKRVCTKNGAHIDTKTIPALSDTTVWTKDDNRHIDPTEDNDGEDVYTSEYGEVTVLLDKLPHTHKFPLSYIPEVKPTEDEEGVKEHWHCDGCGKDFEDEEGTKEVTTDDLKIGKIETEIQASVNVPKPEIATSKEELIAAALTEDEQKKAEKGTNIKIILNVEDAAENIPADDKGNVETTIAALDGHKLGQYLEVTLLKKIGEEREQKITETNVPIGITFEIPAALRGKAEYSVIRVHNGTAAVLRDLDSDPNTVTIETDKFSTYALTYKEKAITSDSGDDPNGGNPGSSSDPSSTVPTESDNSDTTSNVDNSSDTTLNESDTNSSGGTSSIDESNHAPSESSQSEDNGNPSTGIAVSLVPLTAALAAMVVIAKRRRK